MRFPIIHLHTSGQDELDATLTDWVAQHEHVIMVVLVSVASLFLIRHLSTQAGRASTWQFFSTMVNGWPGFLREWKNIVAGRQREWLIVGLLILVALLWLAFVRQAGATP